MSELYINPRDAVWWNLGHGRGEEAGSFCSLGHNGLKTQGGAGENGLHCNQVHSSQETLEGGFRRAGGRLVAKCVQPGSEADAFF